MRRACWEGLRTIGDFVLANGFVAGFFLGIVELAFYLHAVEMDLE